MLKSKWTQLGLLGFFLVTITGCEQMPGNRKSQGATIGGLGGAAVGAAVGGQHRVLGALLGGVVGAAGGYVIAAKTDHINNQDTQAAQTSAQRAQTTPATAEEALRATTADVNGDGFVTLDEVVAMRRAGLSDETMLARLRATGQIFDLTEDQKRYLLNEGVSNYVVSTLDSINKDYRPGALNSPGGNPVISQPAPR